LDIPANEKEGSVLYSTEHLSDACISLPLTHGKEGDLELVSSEDSRSVGICKTNTQILVLYFSYQRFLSNLWCLHEDREKVIC